MEGAAIELGLPLEFSDPLWVIRYAETGNPMYLAIPESTVAKFRQFFDTLARDGGIEVTNA